MDEFSDFQMAGPSPHAAAAHKENRSLPAAGGKGGFHWGGTTNKKQHSPKFQVPTGTHRSQFAEQRNSIQIGPPAFLPNHQQKTPEDKNVGSRLANYDLGRKPQSNNNSCVPQQQQGFLNNVPTNHSLLIGEEDKYAALRALVSFDDETPTSTSLTATTKSSSFENKGNHHGGNHHHHQSFMPLNNPIEVVNDDDFSDFGDFQSFSNPSSIHPTTSASSIINVSRATNGFTNSNNTAVLTASVIANNSNGTSIPPPPVSVEKTSPEFNFGEFDVTVPEFDSVNPTEFSSNLEIRDLNHSVLSHEQNIFIADPPPPPDGPPNFTNLSTDWEDMSSLNFCSSSDVVSTNNYGDMPCLGLDSNDAMQPPISSSSNHHHRQSSNNNNDNNNKELPHHNLFQQNVDNDHPASVFCYVGDNLQNNVESASSAHAISSNIPLSSDVHVLPVSFIKTSLIGCNVDRISTSSGDIDNLESIRSASLMETSNDVLEFIPAMQNRFDISPETRSIASLDLGNYCPTFDASSEGKTTSPDNNMWNGSSITLVNNSKQALQIDENDDSVQEETGGDRLNHEVKSDKYQCFREDLQMETNVHELTWLRCLESVKSIINTAVALFSSAVEVNSTVIHEVVLSSIGDHYINCLSEVYQVFSRIKSHNQGGRIENEKLKDVCAEIDSLWGTLVSLLIGTDVWDKLHADTIATIDGSGNKRCGICLCSVENVQFSCVVEYNEVLYHSGCANLWINNVETRLPSLSAFDMRLDEIVTYQQKTCH